MLIPNPGSWRIPSMEEDLIMTKGASNNVNISVIGNDREKVTEFVYKHLKEVTDSSSFHNTEESTIKEHDSPTMHEKISLRKKHCKIQHGAVFSGKILSFGCSVCSDDITYSPNDLLKHFRAVHEGILPTYPCDLCGFVTNEFPALQRHRIEHRSTQVTCEICNDNVQYSLLWLTRHYITRHSQNGQFHCERCKFTTQDAGTFVQHIHHHNESSFKCFRCEHISLNDEEYQNHVKAHSGGFPFTCKICGFGAPQPENLKKHMIMVHQDVGRTSRRGVEDSSCLVNPSEDVKPPLEINRSLSVETSEPQGISKLNSSGNFINKKGRPDMFEPSTEETQQSDKEPAVDDSKYRSESAVVKEQPEPLMLQETVNLSFSNSASHTSPNGLTVLMVKNKISLPANCTTKVMGFKIVDGKKHLVLKVIPTSKEELLFSPARELSHSESKHSENGESMAIISTGMHNFPLRQRSASPIQIDEDIMTVKVKAEEEESCISNSPISLGTHGIEEETELTVKNLETTEDVFSQVTVCDLVDVLGDEKMQVKSRLHKKSNSAKCLSREVSTCEETNSISPIAEVEQNAVEQHRSATGFSAQLDRNKANGSPEYRKKVETQSCKNFHHIGPLADELLLPGPTLASIRGRNTSTRPKNLIRTSTNRQVFTFHNYSKETFGIYHHLTKGFGRLPQNSATKENLALPQPPEPDRGSGNGNDMSDGDNHLKRTGGDFKLNQCAAVSENSLNEVENPESVFQDFNIIKVEEENVPISTHQPVQKESNSPSLGSFVQQHSAEIISQQLIKDRTVLNVNNNVKPTPTKLQIVQLTDSNQPMFKASESQHKRPVHLKDCPGFKLITNSVSPQINVSYMKPGFELSKSTAVVGPTLKNSICFSAQNPGLSRTTLLSSVQPGECPTLKNNRGLRVPVPTDSFNFSRADKKEKTQPTCYVLHRSVPVLQSPNSPNIKVVNSHFALNSRPILSMALNSHSKPTTTQSGRQAFLVRYISPPKSGILLNNVEGKVVSQCGKTNESIANKVIFKIVTPSSGPVASATSTSGDQSLFLATKPQTQCFLVPSNKSNSVGSAVKKLITIQNTTQKVVKPSSVLPSQPISTLQVDKLQAPRPSRQPSQRKRRRNPLFDDFPSSLHKARRITSKSQTEKKTTPLWQPIAREVERTLKLAPFSSQQQVKCPRRYQPVVVLNHPDADIPEVANIMMAVNRYRGAVNKVSLSEKTVQALSDFSIRQKSLNKHLMKNDELRPRATQSAIQERFLLKLKLRKKSKKKYEVVKNLSSCSQESMAFVCWFCGRLFSSQEVWIGHGQRHLMEATKDWNKLFKEFSTQNQVVG